MTQTIQQVLARVRAHKTCSEVQLRRYLRDFNIRAVGVRQRPQRYPEDTARRILERLGFTAGNGGAVLTMAQLKAEKAKARKGGAR